MDKVTTFSFGQLLSRFRLAARWFRPASVGLFLIFVGLFVLVSRRIAIGQVLGYIVLENGIALFGLTVAGHEPLLIELGILLDVVVGVFVMGIAIVHINREFDHIEVDRLATLRD